jgi:hypothetical protein
MAKAEREEGLPPKDGWLDTLILELEQRIITRLQAICNVCGLLRVSLMYLNCGDYSIEQCIIPGKL